MTNGGCRKRLKLTTGVLIRLSVMMNPEKHITKNSPSAITFDDDQPTLRL